jgi:membrane-associated protease RseP (regulator of RpoE activity)
MSRSAQAVPPFIERRPYRSRVVARPTAREWVRHGAWFLLTVLTTTFAGVLLVSNGVSEGPPSPGSALGYVIYVPLLYFFEVKGVVVQAFADPMMLAQGVTFSAALLSILTAHEFGHYIACRYYRVDATLPFFIPAPPLVLSGTFGAFIKIRSPLPSRRALFDIGVAGPIAGFLVAIPIMMVSLLTAQPFSPLHLSLGAPMLVFNDSLLTQIFARFAGIELSNIEANPLYVASWFGILVTSLNLMPVGQLDGGHATYAVFGARVHSWIGKIAFASVASLTIIGWIWHGSPSGFLYTILLAVALRMRHPRAENESEPLDRNRKLIAALTLLIFILSFVPFPITIK